MALSVQNIVEWRNSKSTKSSSMRQLRNLSSSTGTQTTSSTDVRCHSMLSIGTRLQSFIEFTRQLTMQMARGNVVDIFWTLATRFLVKSFVEVSCVP